MKYLYTCKRFMQLQRLHCCWGKYPSRSVALAASARPLLWNAGTKLGLIWIIDIDS